MGLYPLDVKNLFSKTKQIGFVESIVNNAGFGKFSSIDKVATKDWDDQINLYSSIDSFKGYIGLRFEIPQFPDRTSFLAVSSFLA